MESLVGKKFNKLEVILYSHSNKNWQSYWICKCDCGNQNIVRGTHLKSGKIKTCGCSHNSYEDLTNKQFGKLLVLKKGKKINTQYWVCRCLCGNIKEIRDQNLHNGHSKSCGCLHKNIIRKNMYESSIKSIIRRYKDGAKRRNLEFLLTYDECVSIFIQNCYYCNDKPNQINKHPDFYGNFIYTGIDRIDNTKGYFLENCVPCCKLCNWMKRDLPYKEFLDKIKKIYETKFQFIK